MFHRALGDRIYNPSEVFSVLDNIREHSFNNFGIYENCLYHSWVEKPMLSERMSGLHVYPFRVGSVEGKKTVWFDEGFKVTSQTVLAFDLARLTVQSEKQWVVATVQNIKHTKEALVVLRIKNRANELVKVQFPVKNPEFTQFIRKTRKRCFRFFITESTAFFVFTTAKGLIAVFKIDTAKLVTSASSLDNKAVTLRARSVCVTFWRMSMHENYEIEIVKAAVNDHKDLVLLLKNRKESVLCVSEIWRADLQPRCQS